MYRARLLSILLMTLAPCAVALDRDRTIAQFFHTAWTVSDGGPSGLTQIAQTTDGYLWLATQTGLQRFDGVRFVPWTPTGDRLASNDIAALLATSDGGLWIGFAPSGAAFLKNGQVVNYGQRDGLPASPVYAFGRDGEGTLWAGTARGLRRFDGTRWQTLGPDWGFPDERADRFFLDQLGTLWVSTLDGLFSLAPHTRKFEVRKRVRTLELGETIRSPRVDQTKSGLLWVAGQGDILRSFAETRERSEMASTGASESDVRQILVDRDNTMWIFTYANGIARIPNPEIAGTVRVGSNQVQHFTEKEGLSDNRIMAALEDREGNIWVATRSGLDRFRARNVVPGPFPYGSGEQDLALAADQDGAIWAGNLGQPLMRLRKGSLTLHGRAQRISCALRDSDGTLWFGGEGVLTHLSNGRFQKIALPAGIKPHWAIQSMTRDLHGGLWISIIQNGVFRLQDGVWSQWGNVAALPRRTAIVLSTDAGGRVWFGYSANLIVLLDGDDVHSFSDAEGLQVGAVTGIAEAGGRIWAGGLAGLAVFDGKRFNSVASGADGELKGVSGILEMADRDLWLNYASGLARIAASEVAAIENDVHHRPVFDLFDSRDGVLGIASPLRPLPSAIVAGDGRIWMSGTNGTAWIDPSRIYRNPFPPSVSIESVMVDGRRFDKASPVTLPVLPSNVRIEYTALSLSIPERVHFRYRLAGVDRDWQDVGTRRTAFYTRLGPGKYRFQVIASNNEGVWNNEGAAMEMVVPPAFYQTSLFFILGVSAAIGVLWVFYLLRLRQMAARMQGRLEDRLSERERIARELHDTLLQGVQGLILRFQGAANQIPKGAPVRQIMEDALDHADRVLDEGRDRVRGLRSHREAEGALSESLTAAAQELARDYPRTSFHLTVEGNPVDLHPRIGDEVYRIGREALLNAFYHAEARHIDLDLTYTRSVLRLRLRDDGCGIDPEVLSVGSRPGHWGLTGMHERAKKIGAQLNIESRPSAGTEIELKVPAIIAYRERVPPWFLRWPRRVEAKESE